MNSKCVAIVIPIKKYYLYVHMIMNHIMTLTTREEKYL